MRFFVQFVQFCMREMHECVLRNISKVPGRKNIYYNPFFAQCNNLQFHVARYALTIFIVWPRCVCVPYTAKSRFVAVAKKNSHMTRCVLWKLQLHRTRFGKALCSAKKNKLNDIKKCLHKNFILQWAGDEKKEHIFHNIYSRVNSPRRANVFQCIFMCN